MVVDSVAAAVAALQGDDGDAKRQGLEFLWSQSLGYGGFSDSDLVRIRERGGSPPLLALLESGGWQETCDALQVLLRLARDDAESKVAIREAGGIPPLLKLVKSGSSRSKREGAARALRALASDNDDNAVAIALARGSVEAFVQLARRGRVDGRAYVLVDNAGAAAKRKAALVVAALLRDFPVPREMKAAIASYL